MRQKTTVVCNGCGTSQEAPVKFTSLDGLAPEKVPFVRAPRGWWATAALWPHAENDLGGQSVAPIVALMFVCPGCAELSRFEGAPDKETRPS
jgi:hypothetical protein